jgi:hypothetical protein
VGLLANQVLAGTSYELGNLLVLTPDNPAAGANLTLTLPPAHFTILSSVQFALSTDANAANRYVNVDYIGRGAVQQIRNAATVVVTANATSQVFQFDTAHTVSEWNSNTAVYAPLLEMPLPAGWAVRITVDSVQVGDQIASVKVVGYNFFARYEEGDTDAFQ